MTHEHPSERDVVADTMHLSHDDVRMDEQGIVHLKNASEGNQWKCKVDGWRSRTENLGQDPGTIDLIAQGIASPGDTVRFWINNSEKAISVTVPSPTGQEHRETIVDATTGATASAAGSIVPGVNAKKEAPPPPDNPNDSSAELQAEGPAHGADEPHAEHISEPEQAAHEENPARAESPEQPPSFAEGDFVIRIADDAVTISCPGYDRLADQGYAAEFLASRRDDAPESDRSDWTNRSTRATRWRRDEAPYFVWYRIVHLLTDEPVNTPMGRIEIPATERSAPTEPGDPAPDTEGASHPPSRTALEDSGAVHEQPIQEETPEAQTEEWPQPDFSSDDTAYQRIIKLRDYLAACLQTTEHNVELSSFERAMDRVSGALHLDRSRGLVYDIREVEPQLLKETARLMRQWARHPWPGETPHSRGSITRFFQAAAYTSAWVLGGRWLQNVTAYLGRENPPPHADTEAGARGRQRRRQFGILMETLKDAARPRTRRWINYGRAMLFGAIGGQMTDSALDAYLAGRPGNEHNEPVPVLVQPPPEGAYSESSERDISVPSEPEPPSKSSAPAAENEAPETVQKILDDCIVTRNGDTITVHLPLANTPYTASKNVRLFIGIEGGGEMTPIEPGSLTFDLSDELKDATHKRLRCCVRVGTSRHDIVQQIFPIE